MTEKTLPDGKRMRPIRSFVLREGRFSAAQKRALEELGPKYCLATDQQIDARAFDRDAPLVIDIGFGNGESLLHAAPMFPEKNFLGIEVHRPGVGGLLPKLEEQGINNVRVVVADAVEVLKDNVADHSVSEVFLYFADPWPKARHHKRRIVQPPFCDLIQKKLVPGGLFHLATDWENYAEHMVEVIEAHGGFSNDAGDEVFSPRPDWRPQTRFERRGERLGHGVWDLVLRSRG
ncbi:MAG: tRNA (guanine-N(7)-)-methyltransferase [Lysobacteraceae bacterium]|nr:MAG: tRNA (guanine-N(7)-)-methyltransferase [Xanthomonadaceae bacterium]